MTLKLAPTSAEELDDSSCGSLERTSDATSSRELLRLPLSRGRKEVYNDEGVLVAELPTNDLFANNTNIHIGGNSSGVNIGPQTHFHDPVTVIVHPPYIPQTHNGDVPGIDQLICDKEGELAESHANSSASKPYWFDLKGVLRKRSAQLWIMALLMAAATTTCLIVYFSVNFGVAHIPNPLPPSSGHEDDLGDGIQIVRRDEWLARPSLNVTKLNGPLKIARICHTAGAFCSDYQSCSAKVQAIQGWQVGTQGLPDIAYNYLIGGDGNVYVGRGPDVANEWMPEAIDIGYIGTYLGPYDKMSDKMDEAGKRLIAWLRKNGFITPDYIVIAQNQTGNILSPGENIFKKIVKWPHYDNGLYF